MYIVYCPTSDKPVTTHYTSLKQARKVVQIMREKHPESKFHIMMELGDNIADNLIEMGFGES